MNTRQTILRTALTSVFLALALPGRAETNNPHTDWFSQAKLGVFMHFLPSPPSGPKQVEQFDAKALADQLADIGAGYFVLTLGQNSGWLNAPNAAYDKRTGYAPGERCSKRDLPLELYPALNAKGIRLMLYLPCQVPNQDRRAQKAYGLAEPVTITKSFVRQSFAWEGNRIEVRNAENEDPVPASDGPLNLVLPGPCGTRLIKMR